MVSYVFFFLDIVSVTAVSSDFQRDGTDASASLTTKQELALQEERNAGASSAATAFFPGGGLEEGG